MSASSDLTTDLSTSRDESRADKERMSTGEPEPVMPLFPEGGTKAWLVVLGCWCTSFASFGIVNSFGVYKTYYLHHFLKDFYKKRAMAMALASTGSPLGGIVYPVILNNLISSIGFGWAQRLCGFLSLFLLAIAAVSLRPSGMRRKGNFILLDAFRNPIYSLQVAAMFMVILGLWTPYFYLANYGLAHGMSPNLAGYLFALINAGSFLGRILGGLLANRVGQFNVVTAACYLSSLLLFCWLTISSSAGLVVFAVLFGAVSGAIIALMMPLFAHTADHPSKIGTYIGQSTLVVGFAGLIGTPITGALITNDHGYSHGIVFSASAAMVGAVLITVARYSFANDRIIA
ncbi:MFS general substrate transporter [Aureobasidium pullulans]|nr:MFS general substrate transporter [Aureobasidium pullulans]